MKDFRSRQKRRQLSRSSSAQGRLPPRRWCWCVAASGLARCRISIGWRTRIATCLCTSSARRAPGRSLRAIAVRPLVRNADAKSIALSVAAEARIRGGVAGECRGARLEAREHKAARSAALRAGGDCVSHVRTHTGRRAVAATAPVTRACQESRSAEGKRPMLYTGVRPKIACDTRVAENHPKKT